MRSTAERIADVRRVMEAARRAAADSSIASPLMESTGLSREGVELGLARHLETEATDEQLAALVAAAGDAPRIHVILSANVFVAPLRAIALALAASERVTVRASRREPHFARALVAALGDARVRWSEIRPAAALAGEIHVYGRDETVAAVREAARSDVRVRGHGAGMGVAMVTGELEPAAARLAADVVPFDQRGCLSPRVVFVAGDAEAFGRALRDALDARAKDVPRGRLDSTEIAERTLWTSTVAYAGTLLAGESCDVGVLEPHARAERGSGRTQEIERFALPPTGRHVLVVPIASPRELPARLGAASRIVVTVGSDADPELVRRLAPAHARVARLGEMQRPPLDGPVDRRGSTP